jgi:uncharacterized protein YjdB
MFDRFRLSTLLLALLAVPFIGCGSSSEIDSIAVTPATVGLTGVGATAQLQATATIGHGSHPATQQDVTSQVTWSSGSANVATVSATGFVTSVGPGTVQITASINGFTGIVSSSATITVTSTSTPGGGGTGGTAEPVASLAIIPSSQSVASPTDTTQFLAIGTTPGGATENLTTRVVWSSSEAAVGTIGATTGLATGVSQGTTTITAIWTNPDTTVVTGTATFTVTGGVSEQITAITLNPTAESLSASGQTGQFIAIGTSGTTGLQENVTTSPNLTWTSSIPSIASVSAGLATGLSPGAVTITALWTNPDGSVVSATAGLTITATAAPEPLLSLTIIPASITVQDFQDTGNFLAIGTYSTPPTVRDVTNSVVWTSSEPNVFPVDTNSGGTLGATAGIVTADGSGTAVIIAEATDPTTGSIQTATATFSCPYLLPDAPQPGSCYPGEAPASALLTTITVYNEGLNTTDWLVTAPSATGTADVIHCGPGWTGSGGSVCVATYPNTASLTVILTAPAGAGTFGGWSSNCTPSNASGAPLTQAPYWTAAGPNYCTITLNQSDSSNQTVGAIFN